MVSLSHDFFNWLADKADQLDRYLETVYSSNCPVEDDVNASILPVSVSSAPVPVAMPPKPMPVKISEYSTFIRAIIKNEACNVDSYKLETYISLDGWDIPYSMPEGYSFKTYAGYVSLYKNDVRVCRFDPDEDVTRRMIGSDVDRVKAILSEQNRRA
jgi:hypothetical protein